MIPTAHAVDAETAHEAFAVTPLLGSSAAIAEIRLTVDQVANSDLTVLLQGESGTGKEVVARQLWAESPRASAAFIKVNCAAIPHELLESELFGYEPGAFTGANRQKSGKFELAAAGTIFLDEISEMPPALQAKLLHVLQDGEFSRLGGGRNLSVDARVVAATNVDLEMAAVAGHFRRDLFFRLDVVRIQLPPLRQRTGDLPELIEFFLQKYSRYYQRPLPKFSSSSMERLAEYGWPGNVRELENLVKRMVVLGDERAALGAISKRQRDWPRVADVETDIVSATEVFDPLVEGRAEAGRASLLDIGRAAAWRAEREEILRALEATRWNRRLAAKRLRISYKGLQNKMKALLDPGSPPAV